MMSADLPPDLDMMMNLEQVVIEKKVVPTLREKIISDAACAIGSRGGFIFEANKLKKQLENRANTLDKFSFSSLTLKDSLYPPVISEVEGATYQDGTSMIKISGKVYRIERGERFTLAPLTWRDYAFVGIPPENSKVPMPDKNLLPKTDEEKQIWKREVAHCWQEGVYQAQHLISVNLAKMERDFYGMLLYRKLLSQRLIDAPNVEYLYDKVQGEGSTMSLDNHMYRIDSPSYLKHPEQRASDEKKLKAKAKQEKVLDQKWKVNN